MVVIGDYSIVQDMKRNKIIISLPYGSKLMSDEHMGVVLMLVRKLMGSEEEYTLD